MVSVERTVIGKYEVRGTLGRGAMGVVYDGWHPELDRRVAIKTVPLPDDEEKDAKEAHARFKREAQAAARLAHPNIVGVHDYGETGAFAYIVMEFVAGQTLSALLEQEGRLPAPRAARLMQEVLSGLQFSHDHGIVHRDIKPANIMITPDARAKIADFGVARIESSNMTNAGAMIGTPAYMSPEQFIGDPADARSDIYSAGILLYQMLTGQRPFRGDMVTIMNSVLNSSPPPPSSVFAGVPASLDGVVSRATARRPADRYPTAASFAVALQKAIDAPATHPAGAPHAEGDDGTSTILAAVRFGRSGVTSPAPAPKVASPAQAGSRRGIWIGCAVAALFVGTAGAWLALRHPTPRQTASAAVVAAPATVAAQAPPPPSAPAASTDTPPISPPPPPPRNPVPGVAPSPAADPSAGLAPPPPTIEPPAQTALLPPDPAAIRAALARVAGQARCALPVPAVSEGGRASVGGLVGAGQPENDLRASVLTAVPDVDWTMRRVDGPYCAALDLLHRVARPDGPKLGLALKGGVDQLMEEDPIGPVLNLPDFPAHLRVDYLSSDGTVGHLFPTGQTPDKIFTPNATIRLGSAASGVGAVGPPFGTDMIIAVASTTPLLTAHRNNGESIKTYLADLQAAIDAARGNGTRMAGSAIVFQTRKR